MTLTLLKETIRRFLPVLVPVSVLLLLGLGYFIFIYRPKSRPKPLAHSEARPLSFVWNQDGRKIYYFSPEQGTSPLRVLEIEGGAILKDEVVEAETGALINVFWSSKNRALVWEQSTATKDSRPSIVNFETEDSTPTPLLSDSLHCYSWSPDGARIAYATKTNEKGESNINLLSVSDLTLSKENLLASPLKLIDRISWDTKSEKLFIISGRPELGLLYELYQLDIESGGLLKIFSKEEGYISFVPFDEEVLLLSSGGVGVANLEDKEARIIFDYSVNPYNTYCAWLDEDQIICQVINSSLSTRTVRKINLRSLQGETILTVPVTQSEGATLYFASSPQKDQLAYLDEEGFIRIAPIE